VKNTMASAPPPVDFSADFLTLDTFLETHNAYFTTLSAEEKATFPACQTSAQLIQEIGNLPAFSSAHNERRLRESLSKVQKFSKRLEPYFDAVGILVQSHPEIAGIIWGCIRGTLLVTSLAAIWL
jgi:hypothetical protein